MSWMISFVAVLCSQNLLKFGKIWQICLSTHQHWAEPKLWIWDLWSKRSNCSQIGQSRKLFGRVQITYLVMWEKYPSTNSIQDCLAEEIITHKHDKNNLQIYPNFKQITLKVFWEWIFFYPRYFFFLQLLWTISKIISSYRDLLRKSPKNCGIKECLRWKKIHSQKISGVKEHYEWKIEKA